MKVEGIEMLWSIEKKMCETTRKCRQQCFSVFKKVHNDLNFDETEKPEKTVKAEGRGRGGAGLTFLGLGVS